MLKTAASFFFYGRFMSAFSVLGHRSAKKANPQAWSTPTPDLRSQTWLVTGASAGIGKAVVLEANRLGASIIAVARNQQALVALQKQATEPSRVMPLVCDLSSMVAIAALAKQIHGLPTAQANQGGATIDVLVNNVGVLVDGFFETDEGLERSLATNLLGPVLLTERLAASGALGPSSAIINVSSGGMYGTPLRLQKMTHPTMPHFDGMSAYAMHKRAQVNWTHHWNATHPDGPSMYVMHPGWVDTPGVSRSLPQFRSVMRRVLRTPKQGADTIIWLGSQRPQTPDQGIWLDRTNQPEHAFSFTKNPKVTTEQLMAYFDQTLAPYQ